MALRMFIFEVKRKQQTPEDAESYDPQKRYIRCLKSVFMMTYINNISLFKNTLL